MPFVSRCINLVWIKQFYANHIAINSYAMDRLDLIKKIKESNNSWSFEEIDKFIDQFIRVLKKEYEKNGQVDLGEWGVFIDKTQKADNPGTKKVKIYKKPKGGIKDKRIRAPITHPVREDKGRTLI